MYRLIMRSNMPDAERFQDWVTQEVLPSIRKTGSYGAVRLEQLPSEQLTPEFVLNVATQWVEAKKALESTRQANTEQEAYLGKAVSRRKLRRAGQAVHAAGK